MSGSNLAYNLRPNKAIDRILFVETLQRIKVALKSDFSGSTYYGLGGPFLEDLKILGNFFPELRLVSIEEDPEVSRRQKFHAFKRGIKFVTKTYDAWLNELYTPSDHDIIWADFTCKADAKILNDFGATCLNAGKNSVIKITVNLSLPRQNNETLSRIPDYEDMFGDYAIRLARHRAGGDGVEWAEDAIESRSEYAKLLAAIFVKAAEKHLPRTSKSLRFVPLQCLRYQDSAPMFCLTGIMATGEDIAKLKQEFTGWEFGVGRQLVPVNIDVPDLSLKERITLERHIPPIDNRCTDLRRALGYDLGKSYMETRKLLRNYADFARYYPQFVRVERS